MKNSKKEYEIARDITLGYLVSSPLIKNDILNSKYLIGKVLTVGEILHLHIFGRPLNVIVLDTSPKVEAARVNKATSIKIIQKFNKDLFLLEEPKLNIKFLCNKLLEIKDKNLRAEILKVIKKRIPQENLSSFQFLVGKNYLNKLPELNELFNTLESPIIKKILKSIKDDSSNISKNLILLFREIITTNPNLLESLSTQYNEYLESIELLVEQDMIQQSLEYKGKKYEVKKGYLYLNKLGITNPKEVEGINSLIGIKYLSLLENKIEEISGLERFHSLEVLILDGNQISRTKGLENLTKLRVLDLSRNKITKIEGLNNLKNLNELKLYDNQISQIKGLENLTKLRILNIGRNKITKIEGLDDLKNLNDLFLYHNQITKVTGLESLSNLIKFHIYANEIQDIKGLSYLVNLEDLSISRNEIKDIEGLENLGRLKKISLINNPLPKKMFQKLGESDNNGQEWVKYAKLRVEGKIPQIMVDGNHFDVLDGVLELKDLGIKDIYDLNLEKIEDLVELDLSLNQITDINGLESLTKLEKLNLKGNPLPDHLINQLGGVDGEGYVYFPQNFVEFCRAKKESKLEHVVFNKKKYYVLDGTLNLINLGIRDIRDIEGIESLKNLHKLNLSYNEITEIHGIESLYSLIKLDFHGNKITEIKNLDKLKNLEKLFLYDNKISKITGIDDLKNIKKLDLSFNSISEIKGLSKLSKLKHLELSGNQISKLNGIKELKNLKVLILKDNQLSNINEIENLPNLEALWLSRNCINDIEFLKKLPNLKELFLTGNPIVNIKPIEHLKQLVVLMINDTEITDISALKDLPNLIKLNIHNAKIPWVERKKINSSPNLHNYFRPDEKEQDKEYSEDQSKLEAEYNEYLEKLTPPQRDLIRRYEHSKPSNLNDFLWDAIVYPDDRRNPEKGRENFETLINAPKINFIQNYVKLLVEEPKKYEELAYEIFNETDYTKSPIASLKKDIIKFFENSDIKALRTIIDYNFLTNLSIDDIIEMINHPTLNFLEKIANAIDYYYWDEIQWFFNTLGENPTFYFRLIKDLMQKEESIVRLLFTYGEIRKLDHYKLVEIIQNPKYYFLANFMNYATNDEESGWYFFDDFKKNDLIKVALKKLIIKTINSQGTRQSDLVVIRDSYLMDYLTDDELVDLIKNPDIKVIRYILKMIGIEQYLGESEGGYELGKRINKIAEKHEDISGFIENELHESFLEGNYQELKEIIVFGWYKYIDDHLLKDAIENTKSVFMKSFINLILKGDYVWESEERIDRFIERIYNLGFIERIQKSKSNIIQNTKKFIKDFKKKLYMMVKWSPKELKEIVHEFLKVISESGDLIYVTYDNEKFFVEEGQLTINRKEISDMENFKGFEKLVNLKKLSFSQCPFKEIKGLKPLKNLKSLVISNSEITSTKGLEELTSLKEIKLNSNKINEIIGLVGLKNLDSLDLTSNQIVDIKGLESLTQLKSLNLSINQISNIKGLENLLHLEKLYLGNNKIIEIKNIKSLKNLQHLVLTKNKITTITGLTNLVNLETLYLSDNIIEEITGLNKLENLKSLYISTNKIQNLSGLEFLGNLEQLYLSSNQIQEIKALDKLSNLNRLELDDNKISQIKGLDSLKNLKRLSLRRNIIIEISGLEKLVQLEYLELDRNKISEIKGLGNFSDHAYISLYKNPVKEDSRFKHMQSRGLIEYCRKRGI